MSKKFLVPLGTAIAALLPIEGHANVDTSHELPQDVGQREPCPEPVVTTVNAQLLPYVIQSELHTLFLRRSEGGILSAGHGSHQSHYSHRSHRSGY